MDIKIAMAGAILEKIIENQEVKSLKDEEE